MKRAFYSDSIGGFLGRSEDEILGRLHRGSGESGSSVETTQSDAWREEIGILRSALAGYEGRGRVYFEFSIPRLGKRIDAVAVIGGVVFVIEFKVGEASFTSAARDQVWDYALDLKNFHEPSHRAAVVPVLVATGASNVAPVVARGGEDGLFFPVMTAVDTFAEVIARSLAMAEGESIDVGAWEQGRYCPTPTIIEAATALYAGHSVADISRSDAGAVNLTQTSEAVAEVIRAARAEGRKAICFVTGVPGAGKTLVGLNIATKHIDQDGELYSVFLSGNGPLVAILREALARDRVAQEKAAGKKVKKGPVMSEVKAFIQNVHHFRDDCLVDEGRPPVEHVALFDEAQRAWNLEQTRSFMLRKKKRPDFELSEPEFLISCLDRHRDWAVVVCLVGGGQEINTGEAGIGEWFDALVRSFPGWRAYVSSRLTDSEYGAGAALAKLRAGADVVIRDELHLGVSMRSFRAENVSLLVKQLLDLEEEEARRTLAELRGRYPIVITRDLGKAKRWLKGKARGSERYGMIVSSQAQRLKPHAVDVKSPVDPVHWFLDGKADVRSCYFLEDVATEFHVQGLELDWACVVWDADLRHSAEGWVCRSFCGDRWNAVRKVERQRYLKNAYRVLLTRARQGMVVVVPEGDGGDATRCEAFYGPTFEYLRGVGFEEI